jgi:hypothetical protein
MKHIFFKTAAVGLLALGLTSCADDLNISSIDPQSSPSYEMVELLAKQYATLGVTGQAGPSGKADMSQDEGESGFYRTIFNLQELPTDETIWAWQNDPDIPAMTNLAWTSSSERAKWCYMRLAYDVTLYNSFLTDEKDNATAEQLAEVRFLRALHYYYFLDLFHRAPYKEGFDVKSLPGEKAGKDLYDYIDQELTDIESSVAGIGEFNNKTNFGRADLGAVLALHARLCLNSEIYTDGQVKDYAKAKQYCDQIINSGKYALSTNAKNGYTGYEQVFMGDNDENGQAMKEIIFPIRQDGEKTQEYSGSTYLVSSMRISGMPYCNTNNTWSCNFARVDLIKKFFPNLDIPRASKADVEANPVANVTENDVIAYDKMKGFTTKDVQKKAGDDRALFYMGIGGGYRDLKPEKSVTGFLQGASIVKWSNVRTDGGTRHNDTYSDTDIPLFRLAEIYLTRAEANFRMGKAGDAVADINVLRNRANANTVASVDAQTLIDEWGKEFYMEGRRRSDLVRFKLFTGSKYLWDFKGGVPGGTGVDAKFNLYPIPAIDVSGNPNIHQNKGYE